MIVYGGQPHGRWLSSFCRATAVACLLLTAASSAFAQHISVGIKAGVPLTDVVEANGGGNQPFQAQTKRYTIGPVVDIGLLLGFSVEWEPDADNVYLSSGIDNLALHRTKSASGSSGSSPLDHLGVIVRDAADVDRWAAFLESRFGVRQARYRGLPKTRLQHVLTAVSMNVVRLLAWTANPIHHQTQTSRFISLVPAA